MSPSLELIEHQRLIESVHRARKRILLIKPPPAAHILALAMTIMIAEALVVVLGYVPLLLDDRFLTIMLMLIGPSVIAFITFPLFGFVQKRLHIKIEQAGFITALFAPLVCALCWLSVRTDWKSVNAENTKALSVSRDPRCEILLALEEAMKRLDVLWANYLDDVANAKAGLMSADDFAAKHRAHWLRVAQLQELGKELHASFEARPLGQLRPALLTGDNETRTEQVDEYTNSLNELQSRVAAAKELERS